MRIKTFKFNEEQATETQIDTTINAWLANPGLSAGDLPLRVERTETDYATRYEKRLKRRGYYDYVSTSYVIKHIWYYTAGDVGVTVAVAASTEAHPIYVNVVNTAIDPISVEAKVTNTAQNPVIVSVPGTVMIEPA